MAKGFVVAHEAWYRMAINGVLNEEIPYEINIGDYKNDETVTSQGEFCLVWHQLQSPKHLPAMRIEMFEDSMAWITAAPDLFRELAALHGKNPQPDQIIKMLTRLGYKDVTKREDPDAVTQVARSIADSAKQKHDREKYDQDTERLLNDSRDALLTADDVGRAFLNGKTILYRPLGSGDDAWTKATGQEKVDFGIYEYRVKPRSASMMLCSDRIKNAEEEFLKDPVDEKPVMKIMKPLSDAEVDQAVVDRFNELVREGKIECGILGMGVIFEPLSEEAVYRFNPRPAPRYRPFTAVEAARHVGRRVSFGELNGSPFGGPFMVGNEYIQVGDGICKQITYNDAVNEVTFTDTGDPFGVKI